MDYNRCERGRRENCQAPCYGCSYKHFENIKSKIQLSQDASELLNKLDNEFFKASIARKLQNSRAYIDKHLKKFLKELIEKRIGRPEDLELNTKLQLENGQLKLRLKCDMAFTVNNIDVFIEFKGAGRDTNSILSAITAAQLAKDSESYKDGKRKLRYYYIGNTPSNTQEAFHDKNNPSITPYVEWAENKGILKFYSIVDIENLIKDLKR